MVELFLKAPSMTAMMEAELAVPLMILMAGMAFRFFWALREKRKELDDASKQIDRLTRQRDDALIWEMMLDELAVVILKLDADEQIIYSNMEFEELFDLERSEVMGQSLREVIGDAAYGQLSQGIAKAASGEEARFEAVFNDIRSSVGHVVVTMSPQFDGDGGRDGIMILMTDFADVKVAYLHLSETRDDIERDILKQQRALQELQGLIDEHRRLNQPIEVAPEPESSDHDISLSKAIFNYSGIGVIQIDQNGAILECNHAASEILSVPREDLLSKNFVGFSLKDDRIEERRIFDEMLAGRHSVFTTEKRYERSDGTSIWCSLTLSIAPDRRGVVAFLEDITQRKHLELELSKRADALARSNKELEEFAFVASHDLNEPLDKISAFGSLLQDHLAEKLDDESQEYLDYMRGAAKRMQLLIRSLLDLSTITTKGRPFEMVDLNKVVEQVLDDFKLRIEETEAGIEISSLPVLFGDPVQMRQLLQNLIGNALKFHLPNTPPAIFIRSESFTPQGERFADSERNYVKLIVRDKGMGFEQRHAERIFNPFQRLNPRSAFTGAGIGLAICRKIVDRHGGVIAAKSAPGKGATFAVMLPLVEASDQTSSGS